MSPPKNVNPFIQIGETGGGILQCWIDLDGHVT